MTLALVPKPVEPEAFLAVFSRLSVALRETQDDTGVTQQVYFDALHDLPLSALETSANVLMRQQGRKFFPTTAEWRAEAEKAAYADLKRAVGGGREHPWHYECRDCEDSGWVRGLTCDGGTTCGRTRPHAAHDYTIACPCRPTNRTWLRHHTSGAGAA